MSPKDVLALGKVIARQLDLDSRGKVLEHWLAHHLAELMAEADHAVGQAKVEAEARAVDTILKLWMHRRALPEPADPLGGLRDAVDVLGRLKPEADPWGRHRRFGTSEDLLHDMFEILSRTIIAGLLLTQVTQIRSIAAEEAKGLTEEELTLKSALDEWMPFFRRPEPRPSVRIRFVDPASHEGGVGTELSEPPDPNEHEEPGPEEKAVQLEASTQSAILANLKRMQADLTKLIDRWRTAMAKEPGADGDEWEN